MRLAGNCQEKAGQRVELGTSRKSWTRFRTLGVVFLYFLLFVVYESVRIRRFTPRPIYPSSFKPSRGFHALRW